MGIQITYIHIVVSIGTFLAFFQPFLYGGAYFLYNIHNFYPHNIVSYYS